MILGLNVRNRSGLEVVVLMSDGMVDGRLSLAHLSGRSVMTFIGRSSLGGRVWEVEFGRSSLGGRV